VRLVSRRGLCGRVLGAVGGLGVLLRLCLRLLVLPRDVCVRLLCCLGLCELFGFVQDD
jgi:hypothetical protein